MKHTLNPFSFLTALMMLTLSTTGCKNNKDAVSGTSAKAEAVAEETADSQLLASIERTACYGQCPMYKTFFFDNGEVTYIGKRFVDNIGTYKALLTAEEVEQIGQMAEEYNYFELDSLYPTPVSDFPSCITEVRLNGRYKKVVNRRGPPENLTDFERFLDGLMKGRELEKVSDNTSYLQMER